MTSQRLVSLSVSDTEDIAADIAKQIPNVCFIALYGDLGAGKTAFVRGLCRELVPDARVSSPTYTVVNVYSSKTGRVNHFDMYRVTDEDSLESVGFWDYLPTGVTVCEWSENVPFALPEKYLEVRIERIGETERSVEITLKGASRYADLGY